MGNKGTQKATDKAGKDSVKETKIGEFLLSNSHNKTARILLSFLIFVSLATIGATAFILTKPRYRPLISFIPQKISLEKFSSKEEFVNYLKKAEGAFGPSFLGREPLAIPMIEDIREGAGRLMQPTLPTEKVAPERVSETTVQVKGIDEPDIVKTDGKEIYFSSEALSYRSVVMELPFPEERIVPPTPPQGETKVIKAFPLAQLTKEAIIEKTGNLLLDRNILVLFTDDSRIYGYDVSRPESPTEKWKVEPEQNNLLVDARLYQGRIYFVTKTSIDSKKPCPIVPLSLEEGPFSVKCTDIYHPTITVPVDVTYHAFILNPVTGKIEKNLSFVGSSGTSVIYMSQNALYATYTYYEDIVDLFYNFFDKEGQDLVPRSMIERLKSLREYDISAQAKMVEFQNIFEQYLDSLSEDERLKIENEFSNRMEDFSQEHRRELERTGLVKIDLDGLRVLATGNIPGRPLNQFSLDEYQNHLRIATTIGDTMFGAGESANDVYILDERLREVGSIVGLGLGERIYSARFIEDKGYLVTFKEIDPFFVLDFSNPKKPQVKGELKIPGYSSYLHPITKDKILGVGKESSQVKLSLFDVVSPDNPTEVSKYMLDESWSDILNTHHAFLLDKDHNVFFLPGSKGGYIFSYQRDQLRLTKAVANIQARRAIYINNYMYIIGDDRLVVINEIDWEQVNQLEF